MNEGALIALAVLAALAVFVGGPVLLLVAFVRTGRIGELERRLAAADRRLAQLEAVVGRLARGAPPATPQPEPQPPTAAAPSAPPEAVRPPTIVPAAPSTEVVEPVIVAAVAAPLERPAASLEQFIGRKALGWVAVVVLLFATAFFVRYAFENQWIGPLGRVALGVLVGALLVWRGWVYHLRDWRVFSQMLTAGGIVLVYLSAYAAFGFYRLLPQQAAGLFLLLIVAECGLLALRYDALSIALMSVIGGLLTPILMHSPRDQYVSLFLYLGAINAGVVAMLVLRVLPAVGSLAYLGTQWLFWMWYETNYHPEKFGWAIGFQVLLLALYLGHTVLSIRTRRRGSAGASPSQSWEDAIRLPAVAAISFASAYVLLLDDYRPWLGSLSIALAALYTLVAHVLLSSPTSATPRRALTTAALAVATAFIALAFALEARAPWIALGWAAEAAVLWWFGLRVRAWPLRALAGAFALLAIGRLLIDTPPTPRPPFTPILNRYAVPALATIACLGAGIFATRRWLAGVVGAERGLLATAVVGLLLLVAFVVSVDLVGYYDALEYRHPDADWFRLTQMSLSTWWAVYATAVLAIGFAARQQLFRWTALGLYALTIGKVFVFDMQGLDELYRIVAFFVLAVVLGLAAWAYQRMQLGRAADSS